MKYQVKFFLLISLLSAVLTQGCTGNRTETSMPTAQVVSLTPVPKTRTSTGAATISLATKTVTPTPTITPTLGRVGPTVYPENVNPLTGLYVKNSENLELPPALVSISNSPLETRPQAGLSYAAMVYELYILDGASRFLTIFYGEYPPVEIENSETGEMEAALVGPVRSGRKPYESFRKMYNGFLMIASASDSVRAILEEYHIVYSKDPNNFNKALIEVEKLLEIASDTSQRMDTRALLGMQFDTEPPPGGVSGKRLWLPYSYYNQIFWEYNDELETYHRYQDQMDGETFIVATDRLNGEVLTYENVIILFSDYWIYEKTLFDIDLQFIKRMPALLFRDGQMYRIYWTTQNQEYELKSGRVRPIRFTDYEGNPFPLKPGQTWVEVVTLDTTYYETMDTTNYYRLTNQEQPGSGYWGIYFRPPEERTLTPTIPPS